MDLELGAVDLDELGHDLDVECVRRVVWCVHVVVHEGDGQPLPLRGGPRHQHRAAQWHLLLVEGLMTLILDWVYFITSYNFVCNRIKKQIILPETLFGRVSREVDSKINRR